MKKFSRQGDPYKPVIKPIVASIIAWALTISNNFLSNINDLFLKNQLLRLSSIGVEVVGALSDQNPQDEEQVRQIMFNTVSEVAFQDELRDWLINNLQIQPEQQALKQVVAKLLSLGFDVSKIALDANTDNTQQYLSLLSDQLTAGDMAELIANIVQVWRPDLSDEQIEPLVQLLLSTLNGLISNDRLGPLQPV